MIEFQYFDSCPNSKATLMNLKQLINEGLITQKELKITEVPDMESAECLNFQGSPSILVDGFDIYTESKPISYSYTCRIYTSGSKRVETLPKESIQKQIEKLRRLYMKKINPSIIWLMTLILPAIQ